MGVDNKRLLLEISKEMRELNQRIINPQIPVLTQDSLKPVITAVALARAAYLKELFELSTSISEDFPLQPEQVEQLKLLRLTYDELLLASNAMETAIERGYLDVER